MAITILILNSATAQSEGVFDIEYVPAGGDKSTFGPGGYHSVFGIGGYGFNEDRFGFYGNIQMSLAKREPMYDSLTVSSFGDPVTERYKDLFIIDFGATRKITSNIGAYAGLGYASVTGEAQKYDPLHILGTNGTYYVKDPQYDKSGGNLNAGIIVLLKGLALNFGYHTFTKSTYFGLGWND